MRIDRKAGYIFHLARILQDQPEEKVRAVFRFANAYCTGFNPFTQQNRDFVGFGPEGRNGSKGDEIERMPDLITDVLDRPRRL